MRVGLCLRASLPPGTRVCVYMCAGQTQPGPERNDPFVGFELCQHLPEKLGFNGFGSVTPTCFSPPRSLTAAQASELMERLTQALNLHAADLTQLSYVQSNQATCKLHVVWDGEGSAL